MFENRFYKVTENDGGVFITALFFNPITGEEKNVCVRDYDYADGSRDNDELYHMSVDSEAVKAWKHKNGKAVKGDKVMVVKGRKIPIGEICVVSKEYKVYDRYGRFVALYYKFLDGRKTNVDNCVLVIE